MDLNTYQQAAEATDQRRPKFDGNGNPLDDDHIVVALLGLVGEVGALHTEYKKLLRDGRAYNGFERHLAEELGDILWYGANLASKFGCDLNDIAEANLDKVLDQFLPEPDDNRKFPDDDFPTEQQLPRQPTATPSPEPHNETATTTTEPFAQARHAPRRSPSHQQQPQQT